MIFKKLLMKIDKRLCAYLGLEREELSARSIKMQVGKIVVVHTTSFKRHEVLLTWEDYHRFKDPEIRIENLEKIGLAVGKAIAKRLVVSFEEVDVKRHIAPNP